jgi:outer membrane immunogenic protein
LVRRKLQFSGKGLAGINKQIASLVFGLELDGSWANLTGSQALTIGGPAAGVLVSEAATSKIDGFVTFAGRAGLAAYRWFVFAKGGMALAHETHSFNLNEAPIPAAIPNSLSGSFSGSEYRWGPMGGVGAEYALGGNWSVKAEYNYMNFQTRSPTLRGALTTAGVTAPLAADFQIDQRAIHVAKLGVNYRLGGVQTDPSFAPVPPAPGYNWSGAYIGAQGGYGFGHKEWPDFVGLTAASGKFKTSGWLAGATVGANAQAGVFVFGVEGEWMSTGIKGSQTFAASNQGLTTTIGLESKVDWIAIASARAGFVVGDRLLVYGKAGAALAEERHAASQVLSAGPQSLTANLGGNAVHTGLAAGAGAEYALGGNWSAKFEYDYITMLDQSFTGGGSETIVGPVSGTIAVVQPFARIKQDLQLIKFGVNYHFNTAPVVVSARY